MLQTFNLLSISFRNNQVTQNNKPDQNRNKICEYGKCLKLSDKNKHVLIYLEIISYIILGDDMTWKTKLGTARTG